MFKDPSDLSCLIDHTLLSPQARPVEIENLCEEAKRYSFFSVCVNPCYIKKAKGFLKGTEVKVCTVIGFPLGANTTIIKTLEAIEALDNGADELDVVINIGMLKSGDDSYVEREIKGIVDLTPGIIHKVIIEIPILTEEEKVRASKIAMEAGALFVKTSTGFGPSGATVEDVVLIKKTIENKGYVKASGGIRDLRTIISMVEAGARRIGTSSGVAIMEEYLKG